VRSECVRSHSSGPSSQLDLTILGGVVVSQNELFVVSRGVETIEELLSLCVLQLSCTIGVIPVWAGVCSNGTTEPLEFLAKPDTLCRYPLLINTAKDRE